MGYIAQTYDPFIITDTSTTLDQINKIADLASNDIFPDDSYSNFEVQIWVIMRKLIDDELDRRNRYKKYGSQSFAKITRSIMRSD